MYKIKTINEIATEGLDLLTPNFRIDKGEEVDGILVRSAVMHEMNLNPSVKAVARAGVGVNNIPLEEYAQKGIVVFNTPGANANGVKEIVIAGLMLASRDIVGSIDWVKTLADQGENIPKKVESGKSAFTGPEIKGKTLGVVGLGAVGVLVANAANSLGMTVLGFDPYISVTSAWGLSRSVKRAVSYDELYEKCDYLTLHVPLVDATRNLINNATIDKMKDGVRILNFARSELVDDDAMKAALSRKKVARYITDFPNATTLTMENCISIPHLGASTPESEINCAIMAVHQMMDYLENGNIKNSVNYPECDMGVCRNDARITINHKNIPNMVSQITSVMGTHNINIATMQNMSKKAWAYTVLDLEGEVTPEIVTSLQAIEGVVRVRVL
ncbi:MAG: 3-phosphoglycerate dehydrogenase [Firmicutes bacterium GWF2_51_9]|nr:MAG: 3-phosphoglycerate dehydrogenase [Firmicutes bacterium GWF2_51_9]OGS58506.1 MAG: 3-phosphoglycerate dehydrogenase [Firmicutes bacterium GWE2_51_13]HAM63706.1 3-phosphoglycerate dehydrogenase [Erysipelotrichaceae bacterium]HAO61845.1 3-phosphoglycerate dehydrogenase [Erysipelotrichaceae bacterium]HBZ42332.1 3-phosphoglycerate dehydrogenase [Erysipelotrichaceae bacterium]